MKTKIGLILLAPFFSILFYWVLEQFINLLFNIQEHDLASFVTAMLTLCVTAGLCGIIINKIEQK